MLPLHQFGFTRPNKTVPHIDLRRDGVDYTIGLHVIPNLRTRDRNVTIASALAK
jgi:hypothetical protein